MEETTVKVDQDDDEGIFVSDGSSISVLSSVATPPDAAEDKTAKPRVSDGLTRLLLRSLGLNRSASSRIPDDLVGGGSGRVFGKDIALHLRETVNDVPLVVRVCAECIERFGIVDGIYRLSGISSSIRALKLSFEQSSEESSRFILDPMDPGVRQDIHSISSLLKLYCRELPDPLCTFRLYERFLRAAKANDEFRLGALRQVVRDLPREHFRTLSYLMHHLYSVSLHGESTGMTAKNLAIVWAPNLLRSQHEFGHRRQQQQQYNLRDVAVQATCTECLISHCDIIFSQELTLVKGIRDIEIGFSLSSESHEVDIDDAIARSAVVPAAMKAKPQETQFSSPSGAAATNAVVTNQERDLLGSSERKGVAKRRVRHRQHGPKSLPPDLKYSNKLERSKSSVAVSNSGYSAKKRNSFSSPSSLVQLLQFKSFLQQQASKLNFASNSATDDNEVRPPPAAKTLENTQERKTDVDRRLRSVRSSECLGKSTKNELAAAAVNRCKRSSSSSSSEEEDGIGLAVETDVFKEVNTLQLSFDLEEREFKMMNCLDNSLDCSESSSNNSTKQGGQWNKDQVTTEQPAKVGNKLSLRERMRRFGSPSGTKATLRSKVASVVLSIQPVKQRSTERNVYRCNNDSNAVTAGKRSLVPTSEVVTVEEAKEKVLAEMQHLRASEDPITAATEKLRYSLGSSSRSEKEEEEQSLIHQFTQAWNQKMETISDRGRLEAFDNPTYGNLEQQTLQPPQQDSGFESSGESKTTYENVERKYENVSTYQNVKLDSTVKIQQQQQQQKGSRRSKSVYQNVDFATAARDPKIPPSTRQTTAKNSIISATKKDQRNSGRRRHHKEIVAHAAPHQKVKDPKLLSPPEDESPIYENCDFGGEDSVYQNMLFRDGRVIATKSEDDDVYAQVRFLRQTVKEVNELLEGTTNDRIDDRKAQFQALLCRFDSGKRKPGAGGLNHNQQQQQRVSPAGGGIRQRKECQPSSSAAPALGIRKGTSNNARDKRMD